MLKIALVCFVSYESNNTEKYVKYWYNRALTFEHKFPYTIYGLDTVKYDQYDHGKYKMFVYVDSLGCTSCKLKLDELTSMLRMYRYKGPVYIDKLTKN